MQRVEVSLTLTGDENVGPADELRLADDAEGKVFETSHASGNCSCVHAG
jgi:hypothetical protein